MEPYDDAHSVMVAFEAKMTNYDEGLANAVLHVLGPRPDGLDLDGSGMWREVLARICLPHRWPEELPGLTAFYQSLHELVSKRGGTLEAAKEVRRSFQEGSQRAVLVAGDGVRCEIEPFRWNRSRPLWWSVDVGVDGRAVGPFSADLYVVQVHASPVRQPWWPGNAETLTSWCARNDVDAAARARCLDADGAPPQESRICREMEAMWSEACKPGGEAGTIATLRRRERPGKHRLNTGRT